MCKPLIFWQEPGLPDALVEVNWHWKDSTNLHHDCQKWKVSTRWKSGHVEHFTRPRIVHMLKSYNLRQWLSVMVFVLFGQLDCHFQIWVCLSCRFTEDSRAPWNPCHDRVKDPGDPCCYQYPLGKWQAAYGNGCPMPQWTGEMGTRPPCPLPVPGRTRAPQTQVDRAKKIVENVLAQSLKDASNEALLSWVSGRQTSLCNHQFMSRLAPCRIATSGRCVAHIWQEEGEDCQQGSADNAGSLLGLKQQVLKFFCPASSSLLPSTSSTQDSGKEDEPGSSPMDESSLDSSQHIESDLVSSS